MQILSGHVSPETAYVVDDYPYGFRLRCKIRYWIEYKAKAGFRFASQTSNPKRGHVWNAVKYSTYSRFGMALYLDASGHVRWDGLTEYTDGAQCAAWRDTFGAGVPAEHADVMHAWVRAKVAYDAQRAAGSSVPAALLASRAAFGENSL